MKVLMFIDHPNKTIRIYIGCSLKQAIKAKLKVTGDMFKLKSLEEAEKNAENYDHYNLNMVKF